MSWRKDRAHYWAMRAAGRCTICGCKLPRGESRAYCQRCADRKNARRNEQRRKWHAAGRCRTCGAEVEAGHTRCPQCLWDKHHRRRGIK